MSYDFLACAKRHEEIALDQAQHFDRDSAIRAAAHFAVADQLRRRAKAAK